MIRRLIAAFAAALLAFAPLAASAQTITYSLSSLPLSGSCGTVSVSTPCFDLTQTWNAGGVTFTGLRANFTDTASASGSLLLDLQVGGTSKFSVSKAGVVVSASSIQSGGTVASSAGGGASIGADGSGKPQVVFGSGGSVLNYEAANTLALRNGVNAQQLNIYNTFTDASNYERATFNWNSSVLQIGTQMAGTGTTTRALSFITNATNRLDYGLTSAGNWAFSGTVLFATDNTYDIGASGANRPRDVFNGRDHILGRHLSSTGAAPAVTSCGTSPTIAGSDLAGEVTTGTATPTACTITFNVAYSAQPYCLVTDRSTLANLTSYTVTTAAIVLTTTAASSQKVVYQCIGA